MANQVFMDDAARMVPSSTLALQYCFHGTPEESYAFLGSQIAHLNSVNPQVHAHPTAPLSIVTEKYSFWTPRSQLAS